MTLLLWFCGIAMTGLLLAAWREGREVAPDRWWSYPVQPAALEAQAYEAPLRTSVRPGLQTGVAILAVALALDVSAAQQSWFAPLEPEAASSAASGLLDFTGGSLHAGLDAYAPPSWTTPTAGADGWFV